MGERKSCKKAGRNARSSSRQRYWATQRLQKRVERRIARHIAGHPNDKAAASALQRIEDTRPYLVGSKGAAQYILPGTPAKEKI